LEQNQIKTGGKKEKTVEKPITVKDLEANIRATMGSSAVPMLEAMYAIERNAVAAAKDNRAYLVGTIQDISIDSQAALQGVTEAKGVAKAGVAAAKEAASKSAASAAEANSLIQQMSAAIKGIPKNVTDAFNEYIKVTVPDYSQEGVPDVVKTGTEAFEYVLDRVIKQKQAFDQVLTYLKTPVERTFSEAELGRVFLKVNNELIQVAVNPIGTLQDAMTALVKRLEAVEKDNALLKKGYALIQAATGGEVKGAESIRDLVLRDQTPIVIEALRMDAYQDSIKEVADEFVGKPNMCMILEDLAVKDTDKLTIRTHLAKEKGLELADVDNIANVAQYGEIKSKIDARTDIITRRAGECLELLKKESV
jgi:hypothetical protein